MSSEELLRIESQLARLQRLQERAARSGSKASDGSTGKSSRKDPLAPQDPNKSGQSAKESSKGWRSKVCTGLRVDRRVLPLFKKLCHDEGLTLGRAVEEFMKASLESGSVNVALNGAKRVTEAHRESENALVKLKLADVESMMEAGRVEMNSPSLFRGVNKEASLTDSANIILGVLPRVEDPKLRERAAGMLEQVMEYVRQERLHNSRMII